MKKVLSLILVFLLLFTMVIPAQAAISDSDMETYNYVVAEPGDTVPFVLAATIPTSVTNRLDIEENRGHCAYCLAH